MNTVKDHHRALKVLVLAGGPDREREVSLISGRFVAQALRDAGHEVMIEDITPDNLAVLERFEQWPGDVIFPALHGKWGEGGGLQQILDERGLRYVGCRTQAAALCMDKHRTKQTLARHFLPTAPWQVVGPGDPCNLEPPVVVKAVDEGSSFSLAICQDMQQIEQARRDMEPQHAKLVIERYLRGKELTVGVLAGLEIDRESANPHHNSQIIALPPIQIVPAVAFYDHEAKYNRDDTQYRFEIDEPTQLLEHVRALATQAALMLGVRHLGRVDFIVDADHQPWILEVNTMPGFTSHSLLPMAAAHAGLPLPRLTDLLVQAAMQP